MKIAIIGGSIAGCAMALVLKDHFDIMLFERAENLKSRGAGITLSNPLFQTLIEKNYLDAGTIGLTCAKRSFYCTDPTNTPSETDFWQQGISLVSLHWDTLYSNFRKRIPNHLYNNNSPIVEVILHEHSPAKVTLASGETQEFDLVIFADGIYSLGRSLISPNNQLAYSGYVAWRGIIDFKLLDDATFFEDNVPYYCFDRGHLLAYPVLKNEEKKLNWVFYEKISLDSLNDLGEVNQLNFSGGAKAHLRQLAISVLPKKMAQIVIDTPHPFMQKIMDVGTEHLAKDNALLAGDAGVVLRPHVGSGAAMAIEDALNLQEELQNNTNLSEAIYNWEQRTLPKKKATYALSTRMG
ncbi:MAG: monooxygenase, partial [Legionella sp. 40-6]